MKSVPLLPYSFKWPGLLMTLAGIAIGIAAMYFEFRPEWLTVITNPDMPYMNTQNLIDEIAATLLIVGLMMVSFSRERTEDEFVAHIRLQSLLWSFVIYYVVILISVWLFYDDKFWTVMIYHLFMPLLFYVLLFRFTYWQKMRGGVS